MTAQATNYVTNPTRLEDRRFLMMIGLSVALHGVFIIVVSAWKWSVPPDPLVDIRGAIDVMLVAGGSVEEGSPQKSMTLPRKETFVPPPEEPPAPKQEMVYDSSKEAKSVEDAMKKDPTPLPDKGVDDATKRLLDQSVARLKLKNRVAKLTGSPSTQNSTATSPNGARDGTGEGGAFGGAGASLDPAWAADLNARLSEVWFVLPTLMNKNLIVNVDVRVDAEGEVRSAVVKESSGDRGFDEAAVRAVKKAAPLPLPSKADLRKDVLADGFILKFNPKGLTQ